MVPGVGANAVYNGSYIPNGHSGGSSSNGSVLGTVNVSPSGYTLMVAGQRTGKTSFLRLLLDTSEVSQTATKEQLASVAKFVQGCSSHTSHFRAASIDIELDAVEGNGVLKPLALTLIDTPSLDFEDESASERLVSDVLRYVEQRLAEGVEDVSVIFLIQRYSLMNVINLRSGRLGQETITFTCTYKSFSPVCYRKQTDINPNSQVYLFPGPGGHSPTICLCTARSLALSHSK